MNYLEYTSLPFVKQLGRVNVETQLGEVTLRDSPNMASLDAGRANVKVQF